jgi:SAM-dependent methyltransferase
MVSEARHQLAEAGLTTNHSLCDAQALPFRDASFDAVVANHMLYHVPDLETALSEFTRIVKPSGSVYTATNGQRHLQEIDALMSEVEPGTHWRSQTKLGFSLDEGADDLSKYFDEVVQHEYPDELQVTQPEPLMRFIESSAQLTGEFKNSLQNLIGSRMQQKGHIRIGKHGGLFISRRPRR